MIIKVAYYKHVRVNGTYNMVIFDSEDKTYSNWDGGYSRDAILVEASISRDVNDLREELIKDGYREINWSEKKGA